MASSNFVYGKLEHVMADLKLFSSMNANENRALYLTATGEDRWQIHNTVQTDGNGAALPVVAIALNGDVYLPDSKQ